MSLNVSAAQNTALFLGNLDLRANPAIKELKQVSSELIPANDPNFFDRNHLYFTQTLATEKGTQNDVFVWDLSKKVASNITNSSVSESVPSPLKKQEGLLVTIENDKGKHELWTLALDGRPLTHLVPNSQVIGSQAWINEHEFLFTEFGAPQTLKRSDTVDTSKVEIIDTHVGDSLHEFERSDWFLYVQQEKNQLKAYNTKNQKAIVVTQLPEASKHFSISTTGHVLASDGKTLYQLQVIAKGEQLRSQGEWTPLKVDSTACQNGIGKTAISPYGGKIALVCVTEDNE
jgi:hypothetical protein